jgi:predicted amidophosphoribosyltransferase
MRNTASQTQLNRKERRDNVTGAFVVQKGVELTGRRVTLVDDVATTGATLEACAAALWAEGAEAVNAFTLARAP